MLQFLSPRTLPSLQYLAIYNMALLSSTLLDGIDVDATTPMWILLGRRTVQDPSGMTRRDEPLADQLRSLTFNFNYPQFPADTKAFAKLLPLQLRIQGIEEHYQFSYLYDLYYRPSNSSVLVVSAGSDRRRVLPNLKEITLIRHSSDQISSSEMAGFPEYAALKMGITMVDKFVELDSSESLEFETRVEEEVESNTVGSLVPSFTYFFDRSIS